MRSKSCVSSEADPALANYYLLPSVIAELHAQLGATELAARYYLLALARPCTEPERRFLQRRLAGSGQAVNRESEVG